MKILITGGAGFIGSHLTDQLLKDGHEVTVWDNLTSGKRDNLPSENRQFTFIEMDVSTLCSHNKADWRLLGAGTRYDTIYHLAANSRIQSSIAAIPACVQDNVVGTTNMLEMTLRHQAKFIFASTSCAFGDKHLNPYAMTKVHGEDLCTIYQRRHNLSIATPRIFNVYGDREPASGQYATVIGIFSRQHNAGEKLSIVGDGEQRRDFIHVSDVVSCLTMLADGEWKCQLMQIGTGTNHSINELAEMFQPGEDRISLPHRPEDMKNTKADLRWCSGELGLLDWKPSKKLEDYVSGLVQQTALQSAS